MRGSKTMARASATRCCWPPESSSTRSGRRSRELHEVERRARRGAAISARADAAQLQREGDVLGDAHVREQRVVLEDHADVALVRRQADDLAVAEEDARRWSGRTKPASTISERRLARARGAEQRQELAARDVEVDIVERREVAVALF